MSLAVVTDGGDWAAGGGLMLRLIGITQLEVVSGGSLLNLWD